MKNPNDNYPYPFGDARPGFVIALVFATGLLFASVVPDIVYAIFH